MNNQDFLLTLLQIVPIVILLTGFIVVAGLTILAIILIRKNNKSKSKETDVNKMEE